MLAEGSPLSQSGPAEEPREARREGSLPGAAGPGQHRGQSSRQDGAASEALGNDCADLPAHQEYVGPGHFVTVLTARRHLPCRGREVLRDGDGD